jgi:hypothetical protein
VLVNIDPHFSKALPSKLDYERFSPYFAFKPHDVIQQTLRQTTQLAKSTIHYPMQHHLRSQFQVSRSLGVDLDGPTLMFGGNMTFVLNTSVPSSVLKKKHIAIAYHRVRESIAAKVMRFAYVRRKENVSDILTKP